MFDNIKQNAGKLGVVALALALIMALTGMPVAAAEGDLTVTVTDDDGNTLSNATVTVYNESGSEIASNTTGDAGTVDYTSVGAAGDNVTLEVSHADHTQESKTVTLASNETTTASVSLTPVYETTLYSDGADVAEGENYSQDIIVGENERISEVMANNVSLQGDNLTDGAMHTVTFEITDSDGNVVHTYTEDVEAGADPVDINSTVDMSEFKDSSETYTLSITTEGDAGFTSDNVEVVGETTDEDGGGFGGGLSDSDTKIAVGVVAVLLGVLFLATRD